MWVVIIVIFVGFFNFYCDIMVRVYVDTSETMVKLNTPIFGISYTVYINYFILFGIFPLTTT